MEIAIITAGTKQQEAFWQSHFDLLRGTLLKPSTLLLVVHEDWEGGAGNGLGTLYAYRKGIEKARSLYNADLLELQKQGATVALYHTAGKGMRLYPLAGSEYNNKAAVKLPGLDDSQSLLTILDGVIKQTLAHAPQLAGRLAVFWGDQIFLPSKAFSFSPRNHIDILAKMRPLPSRQEWENLSLDQYGLIAFDALGQAKIVDKCDFDTFQKLIQRHKIEAEGGIGISLGCFSLSYPMTAALLDCFTAELDLKKGRMDSDPFFWMATVLDQETYSENMQKKLYPREDTENHYRRMQKFKEEFCFRHPELNFFGALDIGTKSFWWDYGTVLNYFTNNMKLTGVTAESVAMRKFFDLYLDANDSCLVNCNIGSGNIKNSVLIGVEAEHLDADSCLIVNSKFTKLEAKEALLYHVHEDKPLALTEGTVRSDVRLKEDYLKFYSSLENDGKADWNLVLPGNPMSYEELSSLASSLS